MTDYDVAIIGGGPSGSTLGLLLANAGYQTAIFDRDTFPRNKLCGEFIAPGGHRVLSQLNLVDTLRNHGGSSIPKYEITTRDGETLTGSFDTPGFALSRHRLDILLLREAKSAGADVYTDSRVTDIEHETPGSATPAYTLHIDASSSSGYPNTTCTAQLVAGAYGRRSSLDRKLNRPFFNRSYEYVGFQIHHHAPNPAALETDRVKLYLIPGGYCGIVKIEETLVNVCLMVHQNSLPGSSTSWTSIRDTLLRTNPSLRHQLQQLVPAENSCRTVAQIPLINKESARGRLLFTGDASGMVAPLTGSGQAMAIRSARELAELISTRGLPEDSKEYRTLGQRWSTVWSSEFSNQIRASRFLNALLQYAPLPRFAVKLLKRAPESSAYLREAVTSS